MTRQDWPGDGRKNTEKDIAPDVDLPLIRV